MPKRFRSLDDLTGDERRLLRKLLRRHCEDWSAQLQWPHIGQAERSAIGRDYLLTRSIIKKISPSARSLLYAQVPDGMRPKKNPRR